MSAPRPTRAGLWTPSRRLVLSGGLTGLGAMALSACGGDEGNTVSGRARGEGDSNYISGDGTVEELDAGERRQPVTLVGKTLEGKDFRLEDADEKVVLLNTWGSWCPPCIKEMPVLQDFWQEYEERDVLLLGLVQRDSAETAKAFVASRKVTYPNLADDGGATLRGLQGAASATPTTLVLDAQRRIAARVSGPVEASTLRSLVDRVLGEDG
ncbi:TlpA family protein disulfide reductase [Kytococcus schroeteri]|uniref:Redoxin n=1 Tax=Kytococcus schroeteri TaxID=138300 RepID=A0A2I1PBY0_9MICO|nr:TlpA disulfide reductase family protein [Kytococcus schroeteri]PKZ42139.1 redoxin [Kytococcus schroeteri]